MFVMCIYRGWTCGFKTLYFIDDDNINKANCFKTTNEANAKYKLRILTRILR